MIKQKIVFIINPKSGTGKQSKVEHLIHKVLDKNLFDLTIEYTEYAKHAIEITRKHKSNSDIIVAVGGDGSVNEIGSELINSHVKLGIIPVGSGNGLARHLKIPLSIENALKVISQQKHITIDTVKINNHYFLGTAGVGFDAKVGWLFSQTKKRGFWNYFIITLKEYFNQQNEHYQLNIDEENCKEDAALITFANSNQYGNNAYISPLSVIDDGWIRMVVIKKVPLWYAPFFAWKLFTKQIHTSNFVKTYRGKEIQVLPPNNQLHIDGEPHLSDGKITLKIQPKSLKIIVP